MNRDQSGSAKNKQLLVSGGSGVLAGDTVTLMKLNECKCFYLAL